MKIIGLVFIFISCVVTAREIDFDALEKNIKNKRSISMGFNDASKANNKKFQKINNGQRKTVNKFMSSMAGSTSNSSGSKKFKCTYNCRTDGFVIYDSTDKFAIEIRADKQYEAQNETEKIAKQQCKGMRGHNSGNYMRSTNIYCEQIF